MSMARTKRKLAAILSADVKGYSRLMEDNEEATVRTITAYRELMVNQIQNRNGRIVDAKGDNVLAEFSSIVDAVECAVTIQKEVEKQNDALPEQRKMQFRIGVNLGDVIEEGDTIYGDGVNIAARLEGLAEGGGICISGTVYDQIDGKVPFDLEYLGKKQVKNINKPIRVYRVIMEGKMASPISEDIQLPDKPSIAVLPFVNMSGDANQEYFSDGLTEEIITALSKVPQLLVIARNSTFSYKGQPVDVKRVGRELGVKYVLEGSVRKAEDWVRITGQLIDATTGNHLWAERYDRELKNIFALQDEITMNILSALQVQLTEGEQARISVKGTDNLEAYLKVLQGREQSSRVTREGNTLARRMCEEAIALDPEYPKPYWLLAMIHQSDLFLGMSESPVQSMGSIKELTQKALALDDSSAEARQALCFFYTMSRQYKEGIAEGERAVVLNPSSADCHSMLGTALHFAGRYEEAIVSLNQAIRLNPIPPTMYFLFLGNAYQFAKRYEESIVAYKKALDRNPDHLFTHLRLAATFIMMDREQEARIEASEVLRIDPKFHIDPFLKTVPYKIQADLDLLVSSLRRAGLK